MFEVLPKVCGYVLLLAGILDGDGHDAIVLALFVDVDSKGRSKAHLMSMRQEG